jgi:hypothetical protein
MNKKEKMETALSKLTIEEQELLGLVKKPKVPKIKKKYKLKVFYMIGDANGNTYEELVISVNNPFLKLITDALDKLRIPSDCWGLVLKDEHYEKNYKNGNINELECDLLCLVSAYSEDMAVEFFKKHGFENSETNLSYLLEFDGLFLEDTEYSFLVYQGYKLK